MTEATLDLAALRAGNRRAIAKAITLIESVRADHQQAAGRLLDALLPFTGQALRVGISGAPGVGKSTFIEALGLYLIGRGHRVAVLAIDPSSTVSGGAILGDKTRMPQLSLRDEAFIRPSPSSGSLGGVALRTREAMQVLEAAGFDVVLVETVGVGQSETEVANMTDLFVLLQLPFAGDELQAMKKGIVEAADIVLINKADIDPAASARHRAQFESALGLVRRKTPQWAPPVLAISALKGDGIAAFWHEVERYRDSLTASGQLAARRLEQSVRWFHALIDHQLRARFETRPAVQQALLGLIDAVTAQRISPPHAVAQLFKQAFTDPS